MISITFNGTSVENVNRQIMKYAEALSGLKMVEKTGKHQMGTGKTNVEQPRFVPAESDPQGMVGYKSKSQAL